MKYTTIIGILLIAIALVSVFIGKIEIGSLIAEPEFALGILFGAGSGFLIGGILGWLYKKPYSKSQTTNTSNSTTEA